MIARTFSFGFDLFGRCTSPGAMAAPSVLLLVGGLIVASPSAGQPEALVLGRGATTMIDIDAGKEVRPIPPGAVGWGAMWARAFLDPAPPKTLTDASHRAYIQTLAKAQAPLIRAADVRHLSWPWGVSFSSWGVNWENSAGSWSTRKRDCARRGRTSGWCETAVVGVGDFLTLAQHWQLEAVTVGTNVAVMDGIRQRWGPGLDNAFSEENIERLSDHAARLVDFMKSHPAWDDLGRVYLSVGCEWRHYSLFPRSKAVQTYVQLVRRVRAKIPDAKVIVVASASDSADWGGRELFKANSWNRFLHEGLVGVPGIALDRHIYRGMAGLQAAPDGATPMTDHNIDRLLQTAPSQHHFLGVDPRQWRGGGRAMPTIFLEAGILGLVADHKTRSSAPRPWPVDLVFADLAREVLASPALAFLGWVWNPSDLPREWPFGAQRGGKLLPHARALAFISRLHRGALLASTVHGSQHVRANAAGSRGGPVAAYGGNFSRQPTSLGFRLRGVRPRTLEVEVMDENGVRTVVWDGRQPLPLRPLQLWRVAFLN